MNVNKGLFRFTIRNRLTFLIGLLIVTTLLTIGLAYFSLNLVLSDAPAINIAGSQRMRTFKLAFLSHLEDQNQTSDDTFAEEMRVEIDRFETFLQGLEYGSDTLNLRPLTDAAALAQIEIVQKDWRAYKPTLQAYLEAAPANRASILEQINHQAPLLVVEMDKLVTLFEAQATRSANTAQLILFTLLFFIVLIGVGSFLAIRTIVNDLAALLNTTQKLSEDDLTVKAPVNDYDEIGQIGQTFNVMIAHLNRSFTLLEKQIDLLKTSAGISEELTAILDVDLLLSKLVDLVKTKFDYYHAHIYILDENRQNLIMQAGAGEVGQKLKMRGHTIPLNTLKSLVAQAARNRSIIKIDDVHQNPNWLPNELLPDTSTEMVVPITIGGRVVGVLDVQDDEIAGFSEIDVSLMRSLANQVSIALRNANLFNEVREALAQVQRFQSKYVLESWDQNKLNNQTTQYHYLTTNRSTSNTSPLPALKINTTAIDKPTIIPLNNVEDPQADKQVALVAPIKLQNQTIGSLKFQGKRAWSDKDLSLVQTIIDQAAQTAENLRLFDETRQQTVQEQTLREITDKLRAAPNLDALLETAARELGQRLGVRHTILELGIEAPAKPRPINGNHDKNNKL